MPPKKRRQFHISRLEAENLRNRINANRKSTDYSKRTMVDVPIDLAEALVSLALDNLGGTSGLSFSV